MYQRQLNLNQLLEKSERDGRAKDKQIADLQRENGSLRGQIRSLTAQLDEVKAELWNKINNLTDKLKGAYESLTNVVKAVGMLKYDREKDQNGNYTYGKYGISNLSKAQDKLLTAWQSMERGGRKRRLSRDGRGDGKACRYQQGH